MTRERLFFLDTDIGPDCDDAAALAILLHLCKSGAGRVIGITHCTGSLYGLAAIDAICRRFRVSVPTGTCNVRGFLSEGPALRYTPVIAARCAHSFPPDGPQPDCVDALRQALSGVPDGSVTMIAIGPMINLARYLREEPALMRAKVGRIVCMAGAFEADAAFTEWNVEMDIPSARYVAERWKGPLDFCPFEALADVLTGACLAGRPEHPVAIAYREYTDGAMLRPSWDLGTVAAAVNGPEAPFEWSAPGTIAIDARGRTTFTAHPDGRHRYLRRAGSAGDGARHIEALLERAINDQP